jgi:hypothetical protein
VARHVFAGTSVMLSTDEEKVVPRRVLEQGVSPTKISLRVADLRVDAGLATWMVPNRRPVIRSSTTRAALQASMDGRSRWCETRFSGGSMATATVFVDDAVLGRLPPVCAKTGVETADHLVMTVPVGGSDGFGLAWLLVLAGPIGWLGLFIYGVVRRVETLTVRLPYCDEAYLELSNARRARRNAGLASSVLFVVAVLFLIPHTYPAWVAAGGFAVIGLGMLVAYIAETFRIRRAAVGVDLDGSRRWVTLSRVSDAFAESVKRSRSEHDLDRTS